MALTQISTDGIKNGTITGSDLATNVDLVDNQKLRLGTGQDLLIFHDGSSTNFIDTIADRITKIRADILVLARLNDDKFAKFTAGGSSELYFAGNKRFETTSTGATVTGDLLATGLFKSDTAGEGLHNTATGAKFFSNNSNDTHLEHGSNAQVKLSFIAMSSTYRGAVSADASAMHLLTGASGEQIAVRCVADGTTELRHSGSKKLETTSSGISVTGGITTSGASTINEDFSFIGASSKTITFDKSEGHIRFLDNAKAQFGTQGDLEIYHAGNHSYIVDDGTGDLRLRGSEAVRIEDTSSGKPMITCTKNFGTEIYHQMNSAVATAEKKFETTTTGVTIQGGIRASGYAAITGTPDTYRYGRGNQGGGLSVYAAESALEVVSTEDGTHGGSLLLRTVDDGVGFVYNPTDNALELKSFTPSADDFAIHGSGTNISRLDTHLRAVKDGAVELYHDNSKHFQTTSNGVEVDGELMIDPDAGGTLKFTGHSAHHSKMIIGDNGGTANGNLLIEGGDGTDFLQIASNGDIDIAEAVGQSINSKVAIQSGGINPRGLFVLTSSTSFQSITLQSACSRNTTNGSYRHFQCSINGVADKMRVEDSGNVTNTNNSYGSLSDERLKENIVDASSQWDDIKALRIRKFNFKSLTDPDQKTMLGVVAQEAELVCPGLVTSEVSMQEGVEQEYKSFKYSVLYMKAIKCLQEAMAKIEVLETEVAALKAA